MLGAPPKGQVRKKAVIRGGNWDNGANAGVFAFNANNGPSNWNDNIGFRCGRGVWPDGASLRRRAPRNPPYGRPAPFIRPGRVRKTKHPGEAW